MALACPRCKGSGQVVHLPEFVASLPNESPLKGKYGQPPEYTVQWLLPAAIGALGVVAFVTGAIAPGIVLLVGAVGFGVWLSRRAHAAEEARERWARSLYCRQCPARFLREEALVA